MDGMQDQSAAEENSQNNSVELNSATRNGDPVTGEGEERKITQTDHLNKKLLNSFLDRLNQTSSVPTVERIEVDLEQNHIETGFEEEKS